MEKQHGQIKDAHLKQLLNIHLMYTKQQIEILTALKDQMGALVADIVEKCHSERLVAGIMAKTGSSERTMENLVNILWEPLRSEHYEFTVHRRGRGIQIICSSCPLAGLYRMAGGEDWGYHLYCAADEKIVQAFNPDMGFERTKTLMQGYDSCDHFYYMKHHA